MLRDFIIKNLMLIHSGDYINKFWASFQLMLVPAIGLTISEKLQLWYIDSQTFIQIMFGLLFADLGLGIWKHWKMSTFSFKDMLTGFMTKAILCIFFYFISEALVQILSDAKLDSVYAKMPLKLIIFIYLGGNSMVNMGIISNGKIPPKILLDRIKKFNETLDINDLTPDKNKNEKSNSINDNSVDSD